MADPTRNIFAEEAVVRHIAQDPTIIDSLIQRGISRRWFSDPLYASTVESAIRLRMSGRTVEPLAIMAFSGNGVSSERWKDLLALWAEPNAQGDLDSYLQLLRDTVLVRDFDAVMRDAADYRRQSPEEIRQWLPSVISGLHSITQDSVYDARPSSHFKEDLRSVVATFGIPHIDRFLKGGIWDAAIIMIAGISNHGKSTLGYTLAARCVARKIKAVYVTTETLPSEVVVGVMRPLAGLSDRQVRNKDERCIEHLDEMDKYLPIYDYDYAGIDMLDRILYWEQPQVLFYDFIKAPESVRPGQREDQALYALGEGLRRLSNDHRCTIIAFAQFSGAKAEYFLQHHDLRDVTMFGSARLFHTADQILIMKRHWSLPDTGFFKVKKDRLPTAYVEDNIFDWEFTLRHDTRTHSFYQAQ